MTEVNDVVLAILGGTGDQGRGLARQFAKAGNRVIIGSRSAGRAAETAAELGLEGMANAHAAAAADVIIAAVPYEGHAELLAGLKDQLTGKILVDCVNPLGFDHHGPYPIRVPEGSAAEQAAAVLPDTTVVAAFHHVSAKLLQDPEVASFEEDILVLGEDRAATDLVQALAARIPGMRGVYAGRLRNAGQVEAFTANLIAINRRYKAHSGIRVTGI
ncbi:MAG: NADPH-dependent F420 reductase [Streptosporangiaceae bacterium]|jgi:NADPH-dependent F420 reductase